MKIKQSVFLILVLVIVMVLGVSASAEAPATVTVGAASGAPGDTVTLPVVLAGNTGFSNLSIEIGYDAAALRLIEAVPVDTTGAMVTAAAALSVNPYNISWDSALSDVTFNGTLVTLTFEILTDTNGIYPVTVDFYKGRDGNYIDGDSVNYDAALEPLQLLYAPGSVTVTAAVPDPKPDPEPKPEPPVTDSPTVTVSAVSGKTGDTVEIPIVLADNTGFASLGIEIGYDSSALRLVNVTANDSIGATFTGAPSYSVNPYNIGWESAGNVNFNGLLATLTFEILTDTVGTYPITVDYYKGRNGNYTDGNDINYDMNFLPLQLTYIAGSITVIKDTVSVENVSTAEQIICRVTLQGETARGCVVAALYTSSGRFLACKTYDAQSSLDIVFDRNLQGAYVKVMWWDAFDTCIPMCQAASISLQ